MFINHDKKAVFVHIPKTGGSSLLNILDDGNTVWPHVEGYNHDQDEDTRWLFPYGQHAMFSHLKYWDIELYKRIKSYYKFTIVRNPWSHAVSQYFYDTHIHHLDHTRTWERGFIPLDRTLRDFATYINDVYKSQDLHIAEDKDAYDDVEYFRLEDLKEDVETLMCDRLGYDFKGKLPHDNKNQDSYVQAWGLKYPDHYADFYPCERCIDNVARRSSKVIEMFDYKFEEFSGPIDLFALVDKKLD